MTNEEHPLDRILRKIWEAIEDDDNTRVTFLNVEHEDLKDRIPWDEIDEGTRTLLERYLSDPHETLSDAEIEADHARMRALERSIGRTRDTDFNDLSDGDKVRQVAYRLLFYISWAVPGRCVHDNPVAWSLLDIADRLDLADISEGKAT